MALGKPKKGNGFEPSVFDRARDELLGQIRRCGVLDASEDQRDDWFRETMSYMAGRYPQVSKQELEQLEVLGRRYCEPIIPHGGQGQTLTEGAS